MSNVIEDGHPEWLARIGRAWGWVLAMGVVSVLVGLATIIYPGATLVVVAVLFGVQLIVLAVYRFVDAVASSGQRGWHNVVSAVLAAIAFIAGVYLLRHPVLSILILAVLLGSSGYYTACSTCSFLSLIARCRPEVGSPPAPY
jgi:uncharacterized membrane protein HdeD (DUF308 family)